MASDDKVTLMILDVDLKCSICYKKVKELLCKFPQIRGQAFDEDKNKVRITVVCCNPEKMRDKLCCKGGKAIQRIEILENKPKPDPPKKPVPVPVPAPVEKPKPDPPKMPVPVPVEKPKSDPPKKPAPATVEKPIPVPVPVEKPKPDPPKTPAPATVEKPIPVPAPVEKPPKKPEPIKMPEPMHGCPPAFPVSVCCPDCYQGRRGGPCEYGYGRPVPPPPGPCYDGYGYGYGYGGNRACYVSRCDYFSEENPQGCSIM